LIELVEGGKSWILISAGTQAKHEVAEDLQPLPQA
jgi:hypothetical protein